jgi:hypothetical protein
MLLQSEVFSTHKYEVIILFEARQVLEFLSKELGKVKVRQLYLNSLNPGPQQARTQGRRIRSRLGVELRKRPLVIEYSNFTKKLSLDQVCIISLMSQKEGREVICFLYNMAYKLYTSPLLSSHLCSPLLSEFNCQVISVCKRAYET